MLLAITGVHSHQVKATKATGATREEAGAKGLQEEAAQTAPPGNKLDQGTSGRPTLRFDRRQYQAGAVRKRERSDSSGDDNPQSLENLERAFLEVGVDSDRENSPRWCPKRARKDLKEAHLRARRISDKIDRLARESRMLIRAVRKVMEENP